MKRNFTVILTALVLSAVGYLSYQTSRIPQPTDLLKIGQTEVEDEEEKALFVKQRWLHELRMTADPQTGQLPMNIHEEELRQARSIPVKNSGVYSGIQSVEASNTYLPAGPDNSGGRTRAVAFDRRYNGTTNKVIIAGSVSGGILRSTDGGLNWTLVTPENDIHSFTALAQDPKSPDTWYAGGGEPIANSASTAGAFFLGYGIWKSTNNGVTWTKLDKTVTNIDGSKITAGTLEAFDNPFDVVHRIIVHPVTSDVYIAGHRRIIKSNNGGTSWNVVLSGTKGACSDNGQTDVVVTADGSRLYASVNGGNPESDFRGVWTSTSGNASQWERIAGGSTSNKDTVTGWRGNSYIASSFCSGTFVSKRIVMGIAPSNANILYVTYENGESQSGSTGKPEADLFKMVIQNDGSRKWTNLSSSVPDYYQGNTDKGNLDGVDPFPVQDGYDLTVVVKPDNENVVFLGGVNLFRSTNGFADTTQTKWIGGYGSNFPTSLNIYGSQNYGDDISQWSHPDMHGLVFDPSNPKRAICANDGGIQITEDIMGNDTRNSGVEPVIWEVMPNYQTLQYYHVAMDPGIGRANFIGGAQDNGTRFRDGTAILGQANTGNSHYRLISGDGGAAAIARVNGTKQIIFGSTQFGTVYRGILSANNVDGGPIKPNGMTKAPGLSGEYYGEFVTYYKLDFDNNEDLYYTNFNRLFRTTAASTVSSSSWTELTGVGAAINPSKPTSGTDISITALELSRGDYFPSHTLYIGTSEGTIFRLDNPRNAIAGQAPVNITPSFPAIDGYISDIAVNPNDDAEIMIVVSNYGTTGVFWTKNAKSASPTWYVAEGNLTTPSFRSCVIAVKKDASGNAVTEYYVGTSVGLYSATNIGTTLQANGAVTWNREGGNVLNFAVVTSMDYRPQDNTLLIGTHGNGMYVAQLGTPDFRPNQNTTGINDPIRNDKQFIQVAYPTIANNLIRYQTGNMFTVKRISIRLYTSDGQLVMRKETGYASGQIETSSLARGTYILTITSDDYKQQFIQRIIKQ
jgi:hypothetical protein